MNSLDKVLTLITADLNVPTPAAKDRKNVLEI